MSFALVAGLASSYLSGRSQDKANKANLKQYQQSLAAQMQSNQQNVATRAMALQQGTRGLNDIRENYGRAQNAISGQGVEANRRISDALRTQGAQARAQGYGRGLSSSSAQAGLQGQTAYNISRAQGGVAERLAGLRSRLFEGQGQAMAGGRARIAQILQQNAQGGTQDARGLQQVLQNKVEEGSQIDLSGLGVMLSQYMKGKKGTGAGTPPPQTAFSGMAPPGVSKPSGASPPPVQAYKNLLPGAQSKPSTPTPPPTMAFLGLNGPGPQSKPNPMGAGALQNLTKAQREKLMMQLFGDQNKSMNLGMNAWLGAQKLY